MRDPQIDIFQGPQGPRDPKSRLGVPGTPSTRFVMIFDDFGVPGTPFSRALGAQKDFWAPGPQNIVFKSPWGPKVSSLRALGVPKTRFLRGIFQGPQISSWGPRDPGTQNLVFKGPWAPDINVCGPMGPPIPADNMVALEHSACGFERRPPRANLEKDSGRRTPRTIV